MKTSSLLQREVALRAKSLTWESLNYKPVLGTGGEGNRSSWLAQHNKEAQRLLLAILLNAGVIFQACRSEPASPSPVEIAKSLLTSLETCWFTPWLPLNQFSSSFSECWLIFYRCFLAPDAHLGCQVVTAFGDSHAQQQNGVVKIYFLVYIHSAIFKKKSGKNHKQRINACV